MYSCHLFLTSLLQFNSVPFTPCEPIDCSMPGFPVYHQLPEFTQTHVHWIGDAIQPSHPSVVPFSSHLQSFPASGSFQMSQFFVSGGQSIKSFSFSISPSNECLRLISFRINWFDLAVQGTLKSLQHHSLKASILWPRYIHSNHHKYGKVALNLP